MVYFYSILIVLCSLVGSSFAKNPTQVKKGKVASPVVQPRAVERKQPNNSLLMRTIIAKCDMQGKSSWMMQTQKGFVLVLPHDERKENLESNRLVITVNNGKLFLNDKKVKSDRVIIWPQVGGFNFQGIEYKGSLALAHKDNQLVITHYDACATQEYAKLWHDSMQDKKSAQVAEHEATKKFTVRVMLDERQDLWYQSWKLKCDKGFMLGDPHDTSKKIHYPITDIEIYINDSGEIYINNKKMYQDQLYIMPLAPEAACNDKTYNGTFWILSDDESHKLINCLHIEDYVASVLYTESWPGWSLEVNKAFAIASRTYVIAMVQSAATSKRPYHVKNTNVHQTYQGVHNTQVFKDAVEHTKGLFLSYKDQPITAMFDACCGGIIPAKMRSVDSAKFPYLARKKACEYCKDSRVYAWQVTYPIHELEESLKKEFGSLRRLRDVRITQKDDAGIVHELGLYGKTAHRLPGKKAYSLLGKDIRSFCYTVRKQGNNIIFKGRGLGHHIGLCQWGAKAMVDDGYDHASVLAFYYPGTKLMRLV